MEVAGVGVLLFGFEFEVWIRGADEPASKRKKTSSKMPQRFKAELDDADPPCRAARRQQEDKGWKKRKAERAADSDEACSPASDSLNI